EVTVPHRNEKILMLEASFVESHTGTGLVMSVPAHAPFDYQALVDFKKDQPLGSELQLIKPISIIETEGYGEIPAKEAVEKLGVKDQNDPKLEQATEEIYGKEFYGGVLKQNTEQFAGKKVSEAKDSIKEWLAKEKYSDILLELTNTPVRCRCGAECVVKILTNQWFLNYGDKTWKEKAIKCLDGMSVLPQEIRPEFNYVIGWLHERACARQHGLGTKLPWDKEWIVESLSDSVIYMAYYILAKFVNAGKISDDNLSKEFFDYVFLGYGSLGKVSEITKISKETVDEIKNEFSYFYPVDSRHSGRDLVPNHLTFFVLNHVAIFPENNWPQQIVVNGSVLMDGKKMSKSTGNYINPGQIFTGENEFLSKGYVPGVARFFIMQAHYRSVLDFSDEALQASEKGFYRLMEAVHVLKGLEASSTSSFSIQEWIDSCYAAMNDDFNSPILIAQLFEAV
ncbi:hypothetical protein LCGC14_2643150, partial [marine sediment metagenome]